MANTILTEGKTPSIPTPPSPPTKPIGDVKVKLGLTLLMQSLHLHLKLL